MAYLDTAARPADPRAITAVIAIHAAAGLLLLTGLTVSGVIDTPAPPLTGETIEVELPPPPPPADDQPKPVEPPASSQVVVPMPPLPLPPLPLPQLDTTDVIRDGTPTVLTPAPFPSASGSGTLRLPEVKPAPTPTATFQPTRPVPRSDPGSWVTTDDYRSRWINEGLTGTARFSLSIGSDGRVTACRITRSTGHAALDSATCGLLERRARFTPSKDANGKAVPGTYENAVVWRLPD